MDIRDVFKHGISRLPNLREIPGNVVLVIVAIMVFFAGLATGFMLKTGDDKSAVSQQYIQNDANGKPVHQRGVDASPTIVPIDTYKDTRTKLW